jgi:hypothetical protein
MSSYALSKIRNFRSCNVGWPPELEIDAVIEEITEGWSLIEVCQTAVKGVCARDRDAIRELIQAEELLVEPETATRELHDWSRAYLRDLIEEAETPDRLDELVSTYLEALGEADRARGESYEETADRLRDDIMRAAAARWHELEEEA